MNKRIKKFLFIVVSVILSILLGIIVFILLEVCYNFNSDIYFDAKNTQSSKDYIIAYSMIPGFAMEYNNNLVLMNKDGFRDIDFDLKNRDNKKIAILGDSITLGSQARTENLHSSILSELLKDEYSVFNFGVDGYNTIQEAEVLKTQVLKYNPDIVLVIFCLNDFDTHCDGNMYYCSRARFNKINAFVFYRSWVYRYIFVKLIKFFDGEDRTNIVKMYRKYGEIDVSDVEDEEIGVKVFSQLQKQYGFKCYFFILPYFRNFDDYSKKDEYIHNKLKKILIKYNNIKWFDLKDDFINISKDSNIFSYDDDDFVHPNEYGHELLAKFIYEKLKSDGALN